MVIGYPEGTDVEQELAVEMSSSEPVDVDDVGRVEDDGEVVEEDESLNPVSNSKMCSTCERYFVGKRIGMRIPN